MDPGDKTQLRIVFQMQTCTDKAYAMKKKEGESTGVATGTCCCTLSFP